MSGLKSFFSACLCPIGACYWYLALTATSTAESVAHALLGTANLIVWARWFIKG